MKSCLVCGWQGEPPEWACPCCGETSWSDSNEAPAPKFEVLIPPAPKPSKKAK